VSNEHVHPLFRGIINSHFGLREGHNYDEDCICTRCGFDGAEWWHLEKMKPKEDRESEPVCDRAPDREDAK
jgi:hypothetical protein